MAGTLPAGFSETLISNGMFAPTAMEFAPDGRLFVLQQDGDVRIIKDGLLLDTPFASIAVDTCDERGLLGIAFDPDFSTNHYLYLYYTAQSPAVHNRLSRFTANGDVVLANSEKILLELNNLNACNHNAGATHFGSDGKLYVVTGENGTSSNSQTLNNLLGKVLRLNSDGTIPTDNPFYNTATGKNRAIWAMGLRNPFTFAVQPGSGTIYINDVGQETWEEINLGSAGANYGWPTTEGVTTNPRFTSPIFAYQHGFTETTGCAITGGTFYNPRTSQFPESYSGKYFFADYCTGWIRVLNPSDKSVEAFASDIANPVDLKVGPDGSLYYLARLVQEPQLGNGSVVKISYTGSNVPTISSPPQNKTVAAGQTATFTVSASGPALRYQWLKDNTAIGGATSASYTTAATTSADTGSKYSVTVSNTYGSVTSAPATLTVTANRAPTATILAPLSGSTYAAGETLAFSGSAHDPEDGNLGASAFSWTVVFHHDMHTHPALGPVVGVTSGTYKTPTIGETSTNVWYRINLTVTDSAGMSTSTYVDVHPRTASILLDSNPSGLLLALDGQPIVTPHIFQSVVGMMRTIEATSPQNLNGHPYQFDHWSDGLSASHSFATPASATTIVATFQSPTIAPQSPTNLRFLP